MAEGFILEIPEQVGRAAASRCKAQAETTSSGWPGRAGPPLSGFQARKRAGEPFRDAAFLKLRP